VVFCSCGVGASISESRFSPIRSSMSKDSCAAFAASSQQSRSLFLQGVLLVSAWSSRDWRRTSLICALVSAKSSRRRSPCRRPSVRVVHVLPRRSGCWPQVKGRCGLNVAVAFFAQAFVNGTGGSATRRRGFTVEELLGTFPDRATCPHPRRLRRAVLLPVEGFDGQCWRVSQPDCPLMASTIESLPVVAEVEGEFGQPSALSCLIPPPSSTTGLPPVSSSATPQPAPTPRPAHRPDRAGHLPQRRLRLRRPPGEGPRPAGPGAGARHPPRGPGREWIDARAAGSSTGIRRQFRAVNLRTAPPTRRGMQKTGGGLIRDRPAPGGRLVSPSASRSSRSSRTPQRFWRWTASARPPGQDQPPP